MINVSDCMKMGCASTLLRKHKEHLKEEKKKNPDVKHVCNEECHEKEKAAHQETHDWYTSR